MVRLNRASLVIEIQSSEKIKKQTKKILNTVATLLQSALKPLSNPLLLLKSCYILLLQEKGGSTDNRKMKDGEVIKVKEQ